MLFSTNQAKSAQQSLLSVYLQSILYYDEIISYFAIIFQYFEFIYKYNILYYSSGTIAGELILLSLLLLLNPLRINLGRSGNKGRKYARLMLFILLDILLIVGYAYVAAIQIDALFLQTIIAILGLIFSVSDGVLGIVLTIYYRATE